MKKKILVTRKFVEEYLEMSDDLYGLAKINNSGELKKRLRLRIRKANKYLEL